MDDINDHVFVFLLLEIHSTIFDVFHTDLFHVFSNPFDVVFFLFWLLLISTCIALLSLQQNVVLVLLISKLDINYFEYFEQLVCTP